MLGWIRRLLAPPVFEGDDDKTRAAWLLNIILLTLLARAVFIRLVTGSEPPRPSFVIPFVVLLILMMVVMRRGAVLVASAITVAGFWVSLSAAAVVTGGLHSTGFRNYILPVIVAGLLLGQRWAIATAALSILAGLGMWFAETRGLIDAPLVSAESTSSLELLITHSVSLLIAAVLVTLATRSIERALRRARQEIAERKQAEEAVRASEERFSKAFNLSPLRMGIVRIRDGVIVAVNDCWVRDTQYGREEVVGHPIFELKPWIGDFSPRIRQIIEEGKPVHNWEAQATTKSGESRSLLVSVEVIDLGGEPCFLWVSNDITERKRAEEALRESEELFRTSFENATAGVCLVGTDGKFLSVNPTLCAMLGYSRSELEALSFTDVTPEEDKHIGSMFVARALAGEVSTAHFEKRYLRKDKQVLWAYVSTALVGHPGEGRRYFITYIQDITERKRAETERSLLMHTLNERIKELTALHRTARLLQEDRPFNRELLAELVALLPQAWQYPSVCEAQITCGDVVVRTPGWKESLWTQIAGFVTSNGKQGTVEVVYTEARPPSDEGPFLAEERHLIESVADMLSAHLERKQAEEQIQASSAQLRALMTSLRSAREEEGIRIAREIHDELGSALTSMRWDLEAMGKTVSEAASPPPQAALHAKISSMLGLVDSTIDVVRRIASELRPSILDDLGLAAAVEWQAQQFEARTGIMCRYDCTADNLDLDNEQTTAVFRIFQEALTNVLRHAKATRIDVSLEKEGADFILEVRDNGIGIRDSARTAPSSLGLLGMRERASLIGGTVEITGAEGKGTSVSLRIPIEVLNHEKNPSRR
jgi:PAS domain S-box-containing protein